MKCEKCNDAEATVFYSVISGKFKATRKRYCRPCMELEKVRLSVPPAQQVANSPQNNQSLIDLVQGEMSKKDNQEQGEGKSGETPDKKVKRLEQKMKIAIGKEQYEEAAKIRDEIAVAKKIKPTTEEKKSPI